MKQVLAPATSTGDAGLAASTVYSYAVRAVDNAGNASGMSTTVSTNTPTCSVVGTGQLGWAKRWGGTGTDVGQAVATDGSGNVLVGGSFSGTVDFGTGALSGGTGGAFLAKYAPDGTAVWSRVMSGTGNARVLGIAVDRSGNVVTTGYLVGSVNFGGGTLTSAGAYDIFVAEYSATNGFVWAKRFGTSGNLGSQQGNGVAFDANGDVLVTGTFNTSITFGGATLSTLGGGHGMFVTKLAGATGAHVWSKNLVSFSESFGSGVTVDGGGNALAVGYYKGSVIFGGTTYTNAGASDIVLAKYGAASGTELWIKHFGGPNDDLGTGIAVDLRCIGGSNVNVVCANDAQCPGSTCGSVVIAGEFYGIGLNFGGGNAFTSSFNDVFVAKYAVADGAYIWAKHPAGPSSWENATGVAVDSAGDIGVAGNFTASIDFGGGALTSSGAENAFVAKLSGASGAQVWARIFQDTGSSAGTAVAIGGNRNVVMTGWFVGTGNFGGATLTTAGSTDIFVVDLTP